MLTTYWDANDFFGIKDLKGYILWGRAVEMLRIYIVYFNFSNKYWMNLQGGNIAQQLCSKGRNIALKFDFTFWQSYIQFIMYTLRVHNTNWSMRSRANI